MIAKHDYDNACAWLNGCRRPLLVTHRRPDGDALGALAALTLALRGLGLDPRPTLFEPPPPRYALLGDGIDWHLWPAERAALIAESDAVLVADTCSWSQLEPLAAWLPEAPRTLVIDHHATRDEIGQRPDDLRLIDPTAGAVCLLIAEFVQAAGVAWTAPLATALWVGLATDCGWFRFSNTDGRVLRMAANLVEAGANPSVLYRALYEQDPPAKVRLIARALDSLELRAAGRLAILRLRQADFAAAGADRTMTEDLINEAGRLAGVEATVLLTEEPDGSVRANFRSKEYLDVATLAAQFGGGGHARAAGARPAGAWEEAVTMAIGAAEAALERSERGPAVSRFCGRTEKKGG